METINAGDAFAGAIRALGCECATFSRGRVKVVMPQSVEMKDVYGIAAAQGVQIRRMHHRRDSLEDIFLNAMDAKTEAARVGQ